MEVNELIRYEAVRLFVDRAAAAAPQFTLDDAERRRRRPDLPAARRTAARVGARRRSPGRARSRDHRGAARRPLPRAAHRQPRVADPTAHARGHPRLEPRAARTGRAHAVSEACGVRRRVRPRGGRAAFVPEASSTARRSPTCSGASWRSRWSPRTPARLASGATACSRRFACTRASGSERPARRASSPTGMPHWALALAEAQRGAPRLDRDAANLRSALSTLLEDAPTDAMRLCVALAPFWLRRIDLDEAESRFNQVLAAAPERTPLQGAGALAAAAIDFRSGALATFACADGGEPRPRLRDRRCARGVARAPVPRRVRAGERRRRHRAAVAGTRARRSRGGRASSAGEAICVHSLGVVHWILGDLALAEAHMARSIELFDALGDSPERIPSPVNIAEIRTRPAGGRPGLRVVFEDTLQPFVEILATRRSDTRSRTAPASRGPGVTSERARELLDESAARFAKSDDETGKAAVLVRRAYLEFAERDASGGARAACTTRSRCGAATATGAGWDSRSRDLDSSRRRPASTAARSSYLAEACDIFRRAGDRWGLASTLWRAADLAFARGTAR